MIELLCPCLALYYGVHSLQVGGVGTDRQPDVLVGQAVQALIVSSQVVLYVTRTL